MVKKTIGELNDGTAFITADSLLAFEEGSSTFNVKVSILVSTSGVVLLLAGGTMSGQINMGTNKIVSLANPTDAADATTKAYVDSIAAGLEWKEAARAGTTGNITLTNSQTIDGIAVVNPDRILVKNQTNAAENGIYTVVNAGAWTRTADADTGLELEFATIFVQEGTANASKAFTCTSSNITIGVTDVDFVEIFSTVLEAGDGLVVSGNVVDVGAGTGITTNPNDVALTVPVIVANGGTGAITHTAKGILFGNAASAIGSTAVGTLGQVLTSNGSGNDPTFQAPSSPNVKGGSSTVAINSTTAIVFNTAFATAPNVVVCFGGNNNYTTPQKGAALSVFSISTTGFTVRYDEPDGTGINPATFEWTATDAGDP